MNVEEKAGDQNYLIIQVKEVGITKLVICSLTFLCFIDGDQFSSIFSEKLILFKRVLIDQLSLYH